MCNVADGGHDGIVMCNVADGGHMMRLCAMLQMDTR